MGKASIRSTNTLYVSIFLSPYTLHVRCTPYCLTNSLRDEKSPNFQAVLMNPDDVEGSLSCRETKLTNSNSVVLRGL